MNHSSSRRRTGNRELGIARQLTTLGLLILLLVCCAPSDAADPSPAAQQPFRRLAVIASKPLVESGLTDLVTVALSQPEEDDNAAAGDLKLDELELGDLELVDREEIDAVLSELELAAGGKTTTESRLQLGRILKADLLLFLRNRTRGNNAYLEAVISDCRHGTRLHVERFSLGNNPGANAAKKLDDEQLEGLSENIAATVGEVRRRFPEGVRQIVCVAKILCMNFAREPNHYQAGFTRLLENTLLTYPGIAVVELDEAREIGRELALSGDAVADRLVPLLIEGDFVFSRKDDRTEPTVHLEARITDGADVKESFDKRGLSLAAVAKLLTQELPQACVRLATQESEQAANGNGAANVEKQFQLLTRRADEFATLGYWGHAVALREAALLLKPGDGNQTIGLVTEYYKMMRHESRRDQAFEQYGLDDTGEPWHVLATRLWRSMKRHTEVAVRRKQIGPQEADQLMQAITTVARNLGMHGMEPWRKEKPEIQAKISEHWFHSPPPPEIRDELHQFFRRVYPAIGKLDEDFAGGSLKRAERYHNQGMPAKNYYTLRVRTWEEGMLRNVRSAIDSLHKVAVFHWRGRVSDGYMVDGSHSDSSRYYDTVYDLLTTAPVNGYRCRLDPLPVKHWYVPELVEHADKEVTRLAARLEKTGRADLIFLARRVILERDVIRLRSSPGGSGWKPGERAEAIQQHYEVFGRAKELYEYVVAEGYRPYAPLPKWDPLADLRMVGKRIKDSLDYLKALPDEAEKDKRRYPRAQMSKPQIASLVREVSIPGASDESPRWFVNCDNRFDFLVSGRKIALLNLEGPPRKIFEIPQWPAGYKEDGQLRRDREGDRITRTSWDGQFLWVATNLTGIYLLDEQGQQVAHWPRATAKKKDNAVAPDSQTKNLLPYDGFPHFCPIGPGRILVLGFERMVDQLPRAWIAVLEYREESAQPPRILRIADKKTDSADTINQTFDPNWLCRWRDPRDEGKQKWLIGRVTKTPSHEAPAPDRRPLLVDLATLEVSVCPWIFPTLHRQSFVQEIFAVDASGKIAIPTYKGINFIEPPATNKQQGDQTSDDKQPKDNQKWVTDWTGHSSLARPVRHGDMAYIDWSTKLFLYSLPDWKLKTVHHPHHRSSSFFYLDSSARYGLVAKASPTTQVKFLDKAPEHERLAQFYPRVPVDKRKQQDEAIQAIRKLGGRVGTISTRSGRTFGVEIGKDWKGGQEGFKHLEAMSRLGLLYVVQVPVTPETMELIGRLTTLDRLVLYETGLTDADVAPLANLKQLERLRLEGTVGGKEFTDAVFQHIDKLPIESLYLYGKGFTEAAIDLGFGMPTVSFLNLERSSIPAEVFRKRAREKRGERYLRG